MLSINGWVIVIWLMGSTIYSAQFHLRNYYRSKGSNTIIAKDLEGPGKQTDLDINVFLKKVIGMQVAKILIAIFLIYFLLK